MENDSLERLKARRELINARISRIAARKLAEQRRLDTRRKIVAGAVLLAAIEQEAAIAIWWRRKLQGMRRSQDRQLFELQPPSPPPAAPPSATEGPG